MRCLLCAILWLFVASGEAGAQSSRLELGFGLGTSIYQGDLSPYRLGSFNKPGFSFQTMLLYNPLPALSIRGNFAFASLRENESGYAFAYHQRRNFRFETSVNELSVQLLYNPLHNNGEEGAGSLKPYIFGGAGLSFLGVKRDWSNFDHSWRAWQGWVRTGLAADSATVMPTSIFTLPVGAGIRYFFGENLSLYAEGSHRLTQNGYIDGFSLAANPKNHDSYSTITIGLLFRLSENDGGRGGRSQTGCPVNVW